MLIDLHVHTDEPVAPLLAKAEEMGLGALGFTLNEQFAGLAELRAAAENLEVKVFCGCQVSTNRGELLCFFAHPETLQNEAGWLGEIEPGKLPAVEQVIEQVQARDGVAIAAHPYYKDLPAPMGDHIFAIKGLDACEVASPLTTGMQRDLAIEAAESMKLGSVGGSSAHFPDELGLAMTYVAEDIADEAALVEAIREQRCYAVMGFAHLPEDARPSAPARSRGPYRGHRGRRPRRRSF